MTRERLQQRLSLKWSDPVSGSTGSTAGGPGHSGDVIPTWVAETDFSLPPVIADRLAAAVHAGDVGYPPRDEDSPLTRSWPAFLAATYGWTVAPDQVFGIPGVVAGLYASVGALTAPGDDVVVTPPVYKPFLDVVLEMGRRRVDVPMLAVDGRYRLDLPGLERAFAGGARLLLLCHPHNPTGTVLSGPELTALADLAAGYQVTVVSDEIHAPVTLPGVEFLPYAQVAGPDAPVLTLVSMSKAFSFAGLKYGTAIPSRAVLPRWTRYPRRLRSGVGLLGVMATDAALTADAQAWLSDMVRVVQANVDRAIDEIPSVLPGARVHVPDASYLLWVDVRNAGLGADPAAALARRGVRVSPGAEFGSGGDGFLRLNAATSPELFGVVLARLGTDA